VRVIESDAFAECTALEEVEFGNQLETIGEWAFYRTSLRNINIPKVRLIGDYAFSKCRQLTEAELSEDLERIGEDALAYCPRLRSIAIPLKDDMLGKTVFDYCEYLSTVDVVGGVHKTISSLPLDSWKSDMNHEIGRINHVLPNTDCSRKNAAIQQWMERALEKIEHYKSAHYALLKDNMTQLELALWKAKLHEMEGEEFALSSDLCVLLEKKMTLLEFARWKAKVDEEFADARLKARVNCGATFIIPHVLSFLNDDDVFPLRRGG
jgi:hypothetical protein